MLTKQQFLNKHRARFAGLTKAQKDKRYADYRATQPRAARSPTQSLVRAPRARVNPFACMLSGCSMNYPGVDNTAVVRYQQTLVSEVIADANGYAAWAVTPGAAVSATGFTYPATLPGGVITWGTGAPIGSAVSNMAKSRVVGCRFSWINTQAALYARGMLVTAPFMPDNSTTYWPDTLSNILNLPDCKQARASDPTALVVPPARLSVLREFQDVQSPAQTEKFGNTPGLLVYGYGLEPNAVIGTISVEIVVELTAPTSASLNGTLLRNHNEVPDTPGVLSDAINWAGRNIYAAARSQPVMDTLSAFGTAAAINLTRPTVPVRGARALH